jgi:phosphatidate cytidylyltransferase
MITVSTLVPYLAGALAVGGIAVAVSRRREMIRRWCAWAVGIPAVTGAFWLGPPGAAVIAAVAAVIAAVEFGALVRAPWLDRAALAIALVGLIGTVWLSPEHVLRAAGIGALLVATVPVLAADTSGGLRRAADGVLGLIWLAPLAAMVPLGAITMLLFAAVSIGDIAAYIAGRWFGGPRLSPLSPAKRWSGTLAGAMAAVGALAVFGVFTRDLPASWIPGSGGLLDRVDSLLLALAVTDASLSVTSSL